jgi:bifunctional non-homologous end joining protein LigD
MGLKSYPKTSGKKGIHILIPIAKGYSFKETREFVQKIGESIKKQNNIVITEQKKAAMKGKVHIDYAQNSHGRTMISPYSLRATPNATVSMPLNWREVNKDLKPDDFTLLNTMTSKENPWKEIMGHKQKLKLESI